MTTTEIIDYSPSSSVVTNISTEKPTTKELSEHTKSHSPSPLFPINPVINMPSKRKTENKGALTEKNQKENCTLDSHTTKRVPLTKKKDQYSSFLSKKRRKRRHNKQTNKNINNPHKKAIQTLKERQRIISANILSSYTEEEFLQDKQKVLVNNKAHKFMETYFPSMYNHLSFYLHIKKLQKRREEKHNEIFIDNKTFTQSSDNFFLEKSFDDDYTKIPKKIWSVPNKNINYDEFYTKCIQIWPFEKCRFVKEFSLEFLMNNNYDIELCLSHLSDFVQFMQKKTIEHCMPLVDTDAKIKKNYNLRLKK